MYHKWIHHKHAHWSGPQSDPSRSSVLLLWLLLLSLCTSAGWLLCLESHRSSSCCFVVWQKNTENDKESCEQVSQRWTRQQCVLPSIFCVFPFVHTDSTRVTALWRMSTSQQAWPRKNSQVLLVSFSGQCELLTMLIWSLQKLVYRSSVDAKRVARSLQLAWPTLPNHCLSYCRATVGQCSREWRVSKLKVA
jgi:hypothetical protein